jgi:hypothetical protein
LPGLVLHRTPRLALRRRHIPRAHRLLLANIATTAAGVVTYILLCGPIGLSPSTANVVAGAIIAAVLLPGMLFDGLPRST